MAKDTMILFPLLFRSFIRRGGYSTLLVLTIAIATGATTGILSVTHTVTNRSIGVRDTSKIVMLSIGSAQNGNFTFSGAAYEVLCSTSAIRNLFIWHDIKVKIIASESQQSTEAALVTANAFQILGLKPVIGRLLQEEDDQAAGGPDGWAAIISDSFWRERYGRSRDVIGMVLKVNGIPVRIVGVLPREFRGMDLLHPTDMYLPRHFFNASDPNRDYFTKPGYMNWWIFGRLPEGMSTERATENLSTIEPVFRKAADPNSNIFTAENFPKAIPGHLLNVSSAGGGVDFGYQKLRIPMYVVQILALGVFLLCVCNLGLLSGTGALQNARLTGTKIALGCGIVRNVKEACAKALIVAMLGGVLAIPITLGVIDIVIRSIRSAPWLDQFPTASLYRQGLCGTWLLLTIIYILLEGGIAWWMSCQSLDKLMRPGAYEVLFRSGLWITGLETMVSLIVLTLVASGSYYFGHMAWAPSGFGRQNIAMLSLDLDTTANVSKHMAIKEKEFLNQTMHQPGVDRASTINILPLSGDWAVDTMYGKSIDGRIHRTDVWPAVVSMGYFSTINTAIAAGRDFQKSDLDATPACILSKRASVELFPGLDPIGGRLYEESASPVSSSPDFHSLYCIVVGVAKDTHFRSMMSAPDSVVYLLSGVLQSNILISSPAQQSAKDAVRNAATAVGLDITESDITTLKNAIDKDLSLARALTIAGGACAGIASVVLAIGIFGVFFILVNDRKRYISIEIALGANRKHIALSLWRRMITPIRKGLLIGSIVGILAAYSLGEKFHVSVDLLCFGYVTALAVVIILLLLGAAVPMIRAWCVQPSDLLRCE